MPSTAHALSEGIVESQSPYPRWASMNGWQSEELKKEPRVASGEEGIATIRCHIVHLNGIVQKYEDIGYCTSCLSFDLW